MKMAGDEVGRLYFNKGRLVLFAPFPDLLTPCVESATFGRIDGADHISLENDLLGLEVRISRWYGCQKRLGVGVNGSGVKGLAVCEFNQLPTIHHATRLLRKRTTARLWEIKR